jgi:hypothetical protein
LKITFNAHRFLISGLMFITAACTLSAFSKSHPGTEQLTPTAEGENTMASPLSTSTPEVPSPASASMRIWLPVVSRPDLTNTNSPSFANLNVARSQVARYEKFEVQFDLKTVATVFSLPFDPNPPPGLQAGIGISVDALFSPDNWKTTLVQPAFFFQPYFYTSQGGRDHFTPSGGPRWAVRFAPQETSNWQYRLRAQDANGTTYYPALNQNALNFSVSSAESDDLYIRRGFLRVSPSDPRYFEFEDGTPFVGVGFNDGFDQSEQVENKLKVYEQNKMDFMRVWLSGAGINGSQWTSWASQAPDDGYLPGVSFDTQNTYNGKDVSWKIDDSNTCFFSDFWQGGIPVEPSTTYKVHARVKLNGVGGQVGSGDYGFVIKEGGWLVNDCDKSGTGTPITPFLKGTSDWITVEGTFTTASNQYWLNYLYMVRQNASQGQVYIDEVDVWRKGDPFQVNLLREPDPNSHMYFDPMNSAKWDRFIESAENHGVYLKLVIDEKNEWLRNHLGADGKIAPDGSNDNFYAAPGTKVRWLEQAWWRYIIARWGYSTAIHSFEYVNEGDPYNGKHYEAADAMARYFHEHDPSHHMVTTSFWAGFPNLEFWSNPKYSDVDYADIHAYISTGWGLNASFLNGLQVETRPAYVHSGSTSAYLPANSKIDTAIVPRGLVIKGSGEWIVRYWMKAEAFNANCPYGTSGGMQRVRWQIDGGPNNGGRSGVVPFNSEGKDFVCTSPAGTYDWTEFSSDRDRDGNLLPTVLRLILTDNLPHEIDLRIENSNGSSGSAWIGDIELVSPSGEVVPVIGKFDQTPMDSDTAWFNRAYGELLGGASPVGAGKPLVRGETGIDFPDKQNWNPELIKDTQGIWLHNNLWGQVNPGGNYDLFWWATETISQSMYTNYLTYRNFMEGIPLNNGNYRDIAASTSDPGLRAWGQRDDVNGQMHLWIQNIQHEWKRVVNGPPVIPLSGTITIPGVKNGQYQVEWWNTYKVGDPVFLTQTLTSNGFLTLALPYALQDDVAVKIKRLP